MNNAHASIQFVGDHPVFIEGFPKECARSGTGSLHLYPRKMMEVTSDELAFLKDKRKDIFRFIKVISYPLRTQKADQLAPEVSDKKPADLIVETQKEETLEESSYEKKWKKKGKGNEGA
jgi:hypothetical protein